MAITKKKNGKYQVRVYVGYDHITGKRKTKYVTCETMREARLKEAQLITDVETGELVPEWDKPKEKRHLTFDEAFEEWFDIYKRQGRTNATVQKTHGYFERYLLKPELFGGMYLERMTRRDVQKRVNDFIPKYVESKTIIKYASDVLEWAVDNEEIEVNDNPFNHIQMVKAKKPKKRDVRYYDERQAKLFESGINEYFGGRRDVFLTIFVLLLRTGARIGEVLALRWKDIKFQDELLTYQGRISLLSDGKSEYLEGLKNGEAFRIIEIDRVVVNQLRLWRQQQRKLLFSEGISLSEDDFLFSYRYSNKKRKDVYYKSYTVTRQMQLFIEWYNANHSEHLPYLNVHGFRHTHASLLLSNGVELKKVADRLGHKDITVTANIYADVTPTARREVADKFSEIMGDNA